MSQQVERQQDFEQQAQQWSALMDGEVDEPAATRLCHAWRDDVAARRRWHDWHLIGDVLRSDDLAVPASRDGQLLAALRARLETEPVVLAPAARPERAGARRGWTAAAAVAAGFVAVVGALLVTQTGETPSGAPVLAGAPAQAVAVAAPEPATPSTTADPAQPQVLVANGQLIRDARIDRYLAAHKPFGGSPALAMPTGFVRGHAQADGGR